MQDIISFDFQDHAVHIITRGDEPWFVASDVAKILGYRDAHNLCRNLDPDEKGTHSVSTPAGEIEHTIISESGLYNAVFKSRRDEALPFRRWVTGTVLPEIRTTGRFALVDDPRGATAPGAVLPDVDTTRMSLALSAVSLMRKLKGNAIAVELWRSIGLPWPPVAAMDGDDNLPERIELWSTGKQRFTSDDVAGALGLSVGDSLTRRRIGDVLLAIGFEKRRARRDGALAYLWFRNFEPND